jgi:hypothetical protein
MKFLTLFILSQISILLPITAHFSIKVITITQLLLRTSNRTFAQHLLHKWRWTIRHHARWGFNIDSWLLLLDHFRIAHHLISLVTIASIMLDTLTAPIYLYNFIIILPWELRQVNLQTRWILNVVHCLRSLCILNPALLGVLVYQSLLLLLMGLWLILRVPYLGVSAIVLWISFFCRDWRVWIRDGLL